MKNILKLSGTHSRRLCIIALVAVIGFSFAACGDADPDGGVPKPPAYLVTKWSGTNSSNTSNTIEIKPNGDFWYTLGGDFQKMGAIVFTGSPGSGNFTLYFDPIFQVVYGNHMTGNWSYSENKLTISNSQGGIIMDATYTKAL